MALAIVYVSLFMAFRWLQAPLFRTFSAHWGRVLPWPETTYLILSACLPVLWWATILFALWSLFPRRIPAAVVAGVLWLGLVFIEADHAWYRLSFQHATPADVLLLLTSDVVGDWAVDPVSIRAVLIRIVKHAIALIALWVAAAFLARRPVLQVSRRWFAVIPVLALLVIIDSGLVGFALSRDNREWHRVSDQNPLRLRPLDLAFERLFRSSEDLDQATLALTEWRASPPTAIAPPPPAPTADAPQRPDVLLLLIEGLSVEYVDSTTMPFWTALSTRASVWRNHYSTGNATEYGTLGLIFGKPVSFYRGIPLNTSPQPGSRYIDTFVDRGYDARLVSYNMSCYADIGAYLQNFNRWAYETDDDWALIPEIVNELGRPGPQLVLSLYNGTHLPYLHQPQFTMFEPEVPDSFDYLTNDGARRIDEIRNRYRNTLRELDHWLATLLDRIDLDRTIVMMSGDHGEELFEHGRLGHLSGLEEVQIRTPLLLYAPGMKPSVVDHITSHADVMPTLFDIMGWDQLADAWGGTVFDSSRSPVAIVASKRSMWPPERWAVITEGAKSQLFGEAGQPMELRALTDRSDRHLGYAANRTVWQNNFAEILRFEQLPPPAPPVEFGTRWNACN